MWIESLEPRVFLSASSPRQAARPPALAVIIATDRQSVRADLLRIKVDQIQCRRKAVFDRRDMRQKLRTATAKIRSDLMKARHGHADAELRLPMDEDVLHRAAGQARATEAADQAACDALLDQDRKLLQADRTQLAQDRRLVK